MRGKWPKGGFRKSASRPSGIFFVVGISKTDSLLNYGKFDNFEVAKQLADKKESEGLTCYVYSDDNRVLYSTER